MPIFKIHHQVRYASIPNATLRDKRLSIEARGVLAYLLTHDDKFELGFPFLQKELGVGRDKLKNIVRELKQCGYLCLVAAHNKKGAFDGQEWFVFAEAQDADFTVQSFDRVTENPSDGKPVRRENRQTENPSDNKEENSSQKKSSEEKKEETHSQNANAQAQAFAFPLSELYKSFPELELTENQIGLIETTVKEPDALAWTKTINLYLANHDPTRNRYLPDKVGTLLEVFESQKKKLTKGQTNGANKPNRNFSNDGTKPTAASIIGNRRYRRNTG